MHPSSPTRSPRGLRWLIVLSVVAAACGGVDAAPAGLSDHTLDSGDVERSYTLFSPESSDGETLLPLVINFHGGADTAEGHIDYSEFNGTAEAEGILVAYPNGIERFWNFDEAEVTFVRDVVDHIAERAPLDRSRIYLTGMSVGADFASYLTCADPGAYAAVAAVAVVNHHAPPGCPTETAVPFIGIVGAQDDVTVFGILEPVPGLDTPGPAREELRAFAATNGCDPNPPVTAEGNVIFSVFECTEEELEVVLHPGDHDWLQPDDGLDTNTIIWDFLSRFTS